MCIIKMYFTIFSILFLSIPGLKKGHDNHCYSWTELFTTCRPRQLLFITVSWVMAQPSGPRTLLPLSLINTPTPEC